jgi:CDP-diglyceride synthetase
MPDNSLQSRLSGFMTRELLVRIIAAVVLIPIVLLDVWLGDVWFDIGMALIAALMAAEWCRMVHDGSQRQFAVHGLAAIGSVLIVSRAGLVTAAQLIILCWALSLLSSGVLEGLAFHVDVVGRTLYCVSRARAGDDPSLP